MKNKFIYLISHKKRLIIYCIICLIYIVSVLVIPTQIWKRSDISTRGVISIRGRSMMPSIADNQILYYHPSTFNRGDIVAVKCKSTSKYSNENHPVLIKRIVGLPGETIEITKDGILINGKLLSESYTDSSDKTLQETNDIQEIVLSDDEYFLLGDNRKDSFDSRHVGAFHKSFFLYSLTTKPNEYTLKMRNHMKNITYISYASSFIVPILMFFIITRKSNVISKKKIS